MAKYWVSWWSGNYADEGCTKPPYTAWVSGSKDRILANGEIDEERDECSFCAVIIADSEDEIWTSVEKHYPDYTQRFCILKEDDFTPGDRFPMSDQTQANQADGD